MNRQMTVVNRFILHVLRIMQPFPITSTNLVILVEVAPPSGVVEEVFEMFVFQTVVGGDKVRVPFLVVPGLTMLGGVTTEHDRVGYVYSIWHIHSNYRSTNIQFTNTNTSMQLRVTFLFFFFFFFLLLLFLLLLLLLLL